jgi:TPR repeat protein
LITLLIRTFEGPHGWAPPEVWSEALNWMDLQAMAVGTLPSDPARIKATLDASMSRAKELETRGNLLAAVREYKGIVRNFGDLTDVATAQARTSELQKNKNFKKAEKQEAAELDQQERLEATPSAQMARLPDGEMDAVAFNELRSSIADLKRQAASSGRDSLAARRALSGLVVQAYESGQASLDQKNYAVALQYFDLAAAGSGNPAWAYYQSARIYAITSDKKSMLSELKRCLAAGVHDASAIDSDEFQRYRDVPEFKAVAAEWKRNATP